MPGWYGKIKPQLEDGTLQAFGLIQEQHPERTVLFNQWKQLELPLLVDPLNQVDVSAVPITLLYDESGVLVFRNPSQEQFKEFLELGAHSKLLPPEVPGRQWKKLDVAALQGKFDEALTGYRAALESAKDDSDKARLHFRMGVTHRLRYDSGSEKRKPTDFAKAVEHWSSALRLNPNQYIWRRRIQQYGPVLDKPYPFYSWVAQARKEIIARGEKPSSLSVEPGGAELAGPSRKPMVGKAAKSPDPDGKITRDTDGAISVEQVWVPDTGKKKRAARLHLTFEPDPLAGYSWNNEAEPLQVWFETGKPDEAGQFFEMGNPEAATSMEPRKVELEIPTGTKEKVLKAYALYSICHKKTGTCSYRRQDLTISLDR